MSLKKLEKLNNHKRDLRIKFDSKGVCYACNIGTYKKSDDFAIRIGQTPHHTEYTATVIYYPDGRCIVPNGTTLEDNLRFLRWTRENF